jgi:shikimate dehydrogenase
MRITARSRLLALLGDPVAHSLSPTMYNAAITALGLDAVYVALRVDAAALPHAVRACESLGIAGNVTVPHKMDVARLLIRATPLARELEAANTFWPEGGRLVGDNTDVAGILEALDRLDSAGPWLLAGTGGSARAVAAAARERGVSLLVRSRDRARAAAFAAWARELGCTEAVPDDDRAVGAAINATPVGLGQGDSDPIPSSRLDAGTVVLDLAYAPGLTPWVRACRKRGLRADDGRGVLVAQGALAFERFFPGAAAPREVMRSAIERDLTGG